MQKTFVSGLLKPEIAGRSDQGGQVGVEGTARQSGNHALENAEIVRFVNRKPDSRPRPRAGGHGGDLESIGLIIENRRDVLLLVGGKPWEVLVQGGYPDEFDANAVWVSARNEVGHQVRSP